MYLGQGCKWTGLWGLHGPALGDHRGVAWPFRGAYRHRRVSGRGAGLWGLAVVFGILPSHKHWNLNVSLLGDSTRWTPFCLSAPPLATVHLGLCHADSDARLLMHDLPCGERFALFSSEMRAQSPALAVVKQARGGEEGPR